MMHASRQLACALVTIMAVAVSAAASQAQEFPTRLVKVVVPYPPGGGVDNIARALVERLGKAWNQSAVIENKPGASTMIGGADVARAPADGHTLLLTSDSSITSNPHLFKSMPYDPIKELAPVTQLIDLHQFVLLHPSMPPNTMAELVALAKQKPNAMNYGSYGKGSQPHLMFSTLEKDTGAKIQQVPYRGIAFAMTATLTGEVQMTLGSVSVAAGHIENKTMKALAIGRQARLPSHPQIPTLAEAGFGGIEPRSWFGLFAPAGTPTAVVAKIQQTIAGILNEPEFKARFVEGAGHTGSGNTPAEFARFIAEDFAAKRAMIAAAGIDPE